MQPDDRLPNQNVPHIYRTPIESDGFGRRPGFWQSLTPFQSGLMAITTMFVASCIWDRRRNRGRLHARSNN